MGFIHEWEDDIGYRFEEWRNDDGNLDREDGPALVKYFPDGSIAMESFWVKGLLHCKDGPATIKYDENKNVIFLFFSFEGKSLGSDKKGFWALWERLDEEGRQAQDILKCLARFS